MIYLCDMKVLVSANVIRFKKYVQITDQHIVYAFALL